MQPYFSRLFRCWEERQPRRARKLKEIDTQLCQTVVSAAVSKKLPHWKRIVVQAEDFLSSSVTPATPARSRLPSGCELGGSRLRHLAESCRIFSRIFAENEPRPVFCIDQGSRDLIWERFYPFLIGGSGAGRSGSLKVGPARVFQDRHAAPEGDVFLREDESERHRLCAAGR